MDMNADTGLRWFPRVAIERYSPSQVAWAREHDIPVTGSRLRDAFAGPEDGTVRDEGNTITAGGVENLTRILTEGGGHPIAPGRAVFGVGSDGLTEASYDHVALNPAAGEGYGRTFYIPVDPGFPRIERRGVIGVQATFTEDMANFPWAEWCLAVGAVRPARDHSLRGAFGGASHVMMNRRACPDGYGTKEPGMAWCFRAEISLA